MFLFDLYTIETFSSKISSINLSLFQKNLSKFRSNFSSRFFLPKKISSQAAWQDGVFLDVGLFGINFTFDHSEFYETCARVRPFQCLDKTEENFELENTKPIFNENLILTVHNLYTLSILSETFKIKKLHTPSLLNELLPLSTSSRRKLLLKVQINTNLSVTQHNFIYKAAQVWNKIIPKILNSPELDIGSGVVIPGSFVNSDLTTPIPFIKNRVKKML